MRIRFTFLLIWKSVLRHEMDNFEHFIVQEGDGKVYLKSYELYQNHL